MINTKSVLSFLWIGLKLVLKLSLTVLRIAAEFASDDVAGSPYSAQEARRLFKHGKISATEYNKAIGN